MHTQKLTYSHQMYIINEKYTIQQGGLAVSEARRFWVWFPAGAGPFCVEFECSPCVHMGFLHVIRVLPPSKTCTLALSHHYPRPRCRLKLPTAPQGWVYMAFIYIKWHACISFHLLMNIHKTIWYKHAGVSKNANLQSLGRQQITECCNCTQIKTKQNAMQ